MKKNITMKSKNNTLFSVILLVGLAFSCSQSAPTKKAANKDLDHPDKEVVKEEKQQVSLFPMVIAGSIGIIQEVYFNKED